MRAAALALVLAACGDDGHAPRDASGGPDAPAIALPGCTAMYDAFIATQAGLLLPSDGFDLDGDGRIDNELGALAAAVNPALADNIKAGATYVVACPGLAIPPPTASVDIECFAPNTYDADEPADASNNLSGQGQFLIDPAALDSSCAPRAPVPTIQSGTSLVGRADHAELQGPAGLIDVRAVRLGGTIAADGSSMTLVLAGAYSTCGLSHVNYPGQAVSALSLIAAVLQPDIDIDRDGLETVTVENRAVVRCTDGDGTVIEGASCACDPRIVDGFSIALGYSLVPAHIVGVTHGAL